MKEDVFYAFSFGLCLSYVSYCVHVGFGYCLQPLKVFGFESCFL